MSALLICPSPRSPVQLLSQIHPLSHVPVLGQTLVEYWLAHLAFSGVKQVHLLANDRSECLEALVGDGARWGLKVEIIQESRELTPAEALLKYEKQLVPALTQTSIAVLDHFPGLPQYSLFTSYADWFAGVHAWMPNARMPDRIGVSELRSGVWMGLNARISPTARITGPCWLGKNVIVGSRAVLGPRAIVEDGSIIEADAEVVDSYIAPDTLVGQCTELNESLACGSTLINWKTGSSTEVRDAFILCALRRPRLTKTSWLDRVAEACSSEQEAPVFLKDFLINKQGQA